jgi:alpha-tubulin suppressor-like RCC1 family protein
LPLNNNKEVVDFASGWGHFLVLTKEGQVYAEGRNLQGQLGQGSVSKRELWCHVPIPGSKKVSSVACGRDFSLAVTEEGEIFGFGENEAGQLGLGNKIPEVYEPTKLPLEGVESVVCGRDQVFARTREGKVWVWGKNDEGQLGLGHRDAILRTPVENPKLSKFVQISSGGFHSHGIDSDGQLWGWGFGDSGRLGLGPEEKSRVVCRPTRVHVPGKVVGVVCGMSQSLAMTEEGRIYGWGAIREAAKMLCVREEEEGGEEEGAGMWNAAYSYALSPTLLAIPRGEEAISLFAGQLISGIVRVDGTIFGWGKEKGGEVEEEGVVWERPRWRDRAKWEEVMKWVFLGREEKGSNFFCLPVECVYQLVVILYKSPRTF